MRQHWSELLGFGIMRRLCDALLSSMTYTVVGTVTDAYGPAIALFDVTFASSDRDDGQRIHVLDGGAPRLEFARVNSQVIPDQHGLGAAELMERDRGYPFGPRNPQVVQCLDEQITRDKKNGAFFGLRHIGLLPIDVPLGDRHFAYSFRS